MQYMPTMAFQAVLFMYSAGLGFALAIIYDLFRMLFFLLTGSDKKFTAARDIMFMSVCLAVNFLFLLVMCEGQLLLYVFAGEALGLWAYFYSVSPLIFTPLKKGIAALRKKLIIFVKIFKKIDKNLHNCIFFLRKHLHIRHNIVYNLCVKLCPSIILKKRGDGSGKRKEN